MLAAYSLLASPNMQRGYRVSDHVYRVRCEPKRDQDILDGLFGWNKKLNDRLLLDPAFCETLPCYST